MVSQTANSGVLLTEKEMEVQFDLTNRLIPFLDKHLVLVLLRFLESRNLYNEEDLIDAQLQLLEKTHLVDTFTAVSERKQKKIEKTLISVQENKSNILAKLSEIGKNISPLIDFLDDDQNTIQLKTDKEWNFEILKQKVPEFNADLISQYYEYAQITYNCGDYDTASIYLSNFQLLSTDSEKSFNALWGTLACMILHEKWNDAYNKIMELKYLIDDASTVKEPTTLLHQRAWLIHWSLFVFFNHENGLDDIIELLFQPQYINTIQERTPHILRYLSVAILINKKKRHLLPELMKIIQEESQNYSDPITEFLQSLFVQFDFESARQKLKQCEIILKNDFFLIRFIDEIIESGRLILFENYSAVHPRINIKTISETLNFDEEKAETWITELIYNSKIDGKIDNENKVVLMGIQSINIYQQVIEKTTRLANRTSEIINSLSKNVIKCPESFS